VTSAALAALGIWAGDGALAAGTGIAVACAAWIAFQVIRVSQMRATLPGCKAWDRSGRPLRIEQVL
jgi:hypothetical protein